MRRSIPSDNIDGSIEASESRAWLEVEEFGRQGKSPGGQSIAEFFNSAVSGTRFAFLEVLLHRPSIHYVARMFRLKYVAKCGYGIEGTCKRRCSSQYGNTILANFFVDQSIYVIESAEQSQGFIVYPK